MKVNIESIRIDGGTQPRVEIDYELVHEYSENIEQLPPVVLFFDGADHWLADGFHRYHSHKKLNLLEIEAEVKQGSKRDAVLYSVGANAQHGKRRTNADKRKAVLALLNDEEWGKWSDSEIARICFVHRTFVGKLRSHEIISCEKTYTTKHGTIATMNTANIGKSQSSYTAPDEEQGEEENVKPIIQKRVVLTKKERENVPCSADQYVGFAKCQIQKIQKGDKSAVIAIDNFISWLETFKGEIA